VITQRLADRTGLTGSAIGQTVEYHNRTYRITGVLEAYKERDVEQESSVLFMPFSLSDDTKLDWEFVVRHRPGMGKVNLFGLMGVFMSGIPTVFLLIFALMGTFGVVGCNRKSVYAKWGCVSL
jgi:hypothetical protein